MPRTFHDLGLAPELLTTLEGLGYLEPTPIQEEAIPPLLAGRDVMGQAQTGTGKTAAFALPTLQQMDMTALQTLILTPTRELAIQVAENVHRYGEDIGARVLPIYGGQSYDRQKRRLKKGVHVVVGTPGRTLDLINQRALDVSAVRYLILDEADEMLKMGFIEDMEQIIRATDASQRQTILFSATFSEPIRKIANQYMREPVRITVKAETVTAANVAQRYYVVQERDKIAALSRLLEVEAQQSTLVFARTKAGAAELAETLIERGYPAEAIHGDLSQNDRERILNRFRKGQLTILVATDVMARGVDIPDVSHVVNFDIPQLAIEYVHRIGRTGRAGRSGQASTFITPHQRRLLKTIEDYTSQAIDKAKLPSREDVLLHREARFRADVLEHIEADTADAHSDLLDDLLAQGYTAEQVAAGLMSLLRSQVTDQPLEEIRSVKEYSDNGGDGRKRGSKGRNGRSGGGGRSRGHEPGMVTLHMAIGRSNGLKPGDVVYNIASKANIPGHVIGAIDIRQNETFLDVPQDHVDAVLSSMKNLKIRGRAANLERAGESQGE